MINKFITPGHFKNIPYKTTLNSELRYPEQASLINIIQASENASNILQGKKNNIFALKGDRFELRNRLNAEFDNLFPTLLPHNRYRGLANLPDDVYQKVLNLKKGDIVQDKGFAYFSKSKAIAEEFANGNKPIFIKCKIPIWSKVSRMLGAIASFQNGILWLKSGETMTPAGSSFKILKNKINKRGVVNLVIKYLK